MKNKLKHLFKLGILILGISLFIVSCQKDDDINISNKEINGEKSPFKFSEINESEINQNKNLGRKLKSITNNIKQSKLANANKLIYSAEDDFYIDTDYATYIENTETNYHSYTFPVFRITQTNNIENVLLSLQADGSYKAMLVTYNLTAQERIDIDNGININFNDKVNIYSLEDDAFVNDIFSKILYVDNCVSINYNVIPCDGGYSEEHTSRPNSTLGRDCSGTSTQFVSFSVNPACTSGGGSSNNTYNPPNNPSGYDTSGGHGTGGAFNGSGNHTSMTKPQPWQEIAMCINSFQQDGNTDNTTLTPEMFAWLQSQPKFIIGSINSNLQANNCSEEAQEEAIEDLISLFEECVNNGVCDNSWIEDEQNKNQLCGTYNFNTIGNASVANISGLGLFARNSTGGILSVTFGTPLCVTIPNYNLPLSQSSAKFNIAWTLTMSEVLTFMNNTEGIFNPTPTAIRALILEYLTINLNLIASVPAGVSVISSSCPGVPVTPAVYCP